MSWGAQTDAAEARKIFDHAREHGITHFDTAEIYNGGRSEEMLGEMIADCREDVQVATKIGYYLSKPLDVRASVEGCLKRLKTDYLDIVYLHRFGALEDPDGELSVLASMIDDDIVQSVGVSNCAAWQVASMGGWVDDIIVAIQPQYSMLKRQAEVELFPMAQAHKLKVYTYSPLARGLLAGKMMCDLDPRYQRRFCDRPWDGVTPGPSAAISWTRSHPAVTGVIIGPSTLEQLGVCLESTDKLSPAERRAMNIIPDPAPADDRPDERGTDA